MFLCATQNKLIKTFTTRELAQSQLLVKFKHMKIKTFVFSPFSENTYVVWDGTRECIIIDPGCYDKYEQNILLTFLKEKKLKPVKLLNTHCHIDHIFGNKFVTDTFNLPAEAHVTENSNIQYSADKAILFGVKMEAPYPVTNFINENDTIKFGNSELKIMHVPGHTEGSLIFHNEDEKFAIVGDVLFNQSIGRTDLPGGNYETLIEGIRTKLYKLAPETVVYSGHGETTTIGNEQRNNPFVRL